jgi:hypothetical protein
VDPDPNRVHSTTIRLNRDRGKTVTTSGEPTDPAGISAPKTVGLLDEGCDDLRLRHRLDDLTR